MDGVFFLRFRTFGSVLGVALSHYLGSKNLDKEPDQQDRFCPWKCKIWDCGWIHNPGPLTMMMMTTTSACHLFWAGGLNHGLESVRGSFAAFSLLRGKQSWLAGNVPVDELPRRQSQDFPLPSLMKFHNSTWTTAPRPETASCCFTFLVRTPKNALETNETISKHPDEPLWTGRIYVTPFVG